MKVVKDGGYEFELSTCDTGECVINYCKVKVQVQNKGGYLLNPVFYTWKVEPTPNLDNQYTTWLACWISTLNEIGEVRRF